MADRLSVLKYYLYYKYKKRFSDRSALERWQVEKIRKHLEYVGEHSRLYKGMKKLSSYPVIDKKFMMEHFDELNTVGIGKTGDYSGIGRREKPLGRIYSCKVPGGKSV